MTPDEFSERIKRVWDALPENALEAMSVLGCICNAYVSEVEKQRPGMAMAWMTMLQGMFDQAGVKT